MVIKNHHLKTESMLKNSLGLLIIALLLFSCDKKRVFDQYKSVGGNWNKDSIVSFDLPKLESQKY